MLNVKVLVGAFNQEKALVGAFSVIVQPVVEPMDRFAALIRMKASRYLLRYTPSLFSENFNIMKKTSHLL